MNANALKTLLEGKTVKLVNTFTGEDICEIFLTDGTHFKLSTNDCGSWITMLSSDTGFDCFKSLLDRLLERIVEIGAFDPEEIDLSISIKDGLITFLLDKEEFKLLFKNLKQNELQYFINDHARFNLVKSLITKNYYWENYYKGLL